MSRAFFVLFLSMLLSACGGSSTDTAQPESPATQQTLEISVLHGMVAAGTPVEIHSVEGSPQLLGSANTDSSGKVSITVNRKESYRIVFNPFNAFIALKCPLAAGCFTEGNNRFVAFGSPISSRLALSAYHNAAQGTKVDVGVLSDLVAKLYQSGVYADTAKPLKTIQSFVANVFGHIGYETAFQIKESDIRNSTLIKAIDAAGIAQSGIVAANGNAALTAMSRRLIEHIAGDLQAMVSLNDLWIKDTLDYLQAEMLDCSTCSEADFASLSRVRAVIASRYHPLVTPYMPSPAVELEQPIARAKQNMTDFRALYYSLDSETPAYTTVISDVRNLGTIVTEFATLVTEDLFDLFADVLSEVPVGSKDGDYKLGSLNINYTDSTQQWVLKGTYKDQTVDATVTMISLQINTGGESRIEAELNGSIVNPRLNSTLNAVRFNLVSFGENAQQKPKSTGYIAVDGDFLLRRGASVYEGMVRSRLESIITADDIDKQVLESVYLSGELRRAANTSRVTISLVNPSLFLESETTDVIPEHVVTGISYNDTLEGLSSSSLTLFFPFQDLNSFRIQDNIDVSASFAGRFMEFKFSGTNTTFDYSGRTQDDISWDFKVDDRIPSGFKYFNDTKIGEVRMLKDVPGVMFTDGNFVSIF
ncbi:MAG: hypothetical protein K2W88_20500 [Pararheinheimera sp.]|nr:hypothetical protein [Rheinheimera sp.]